MSPKGPFYLRLDFTENRNLLHKIEALPIENPPRPGLDIAAPTMSSLGSSFTGSRACFMQTIWRSGSSNRLT